MIDKIKISKTLKRLDTEYSKCISDPDMPILFSKLAVMEFCGWIEMSYDTILYEYIDSHIIETSCKKIIKGFIKNNSGFAYDKNTFKTFAIVLGANNWENVLDAISIEDKENFINILENYTKIRNRAAHTNTAGTTTTYYTPSNVIKDFNLFLPAISIIENEINKI